jgi:hypothetical protein
VSASTYNPNPQKCLDTLQNKCVVEHTYDIEYEDGNISSYIADCDDMILVSFRGTNTDTQLFWEFMELDDMSDYMNTKVQTYFLGAYLKVYDLMDKDIHNILINNNKKVFITGHSLGAALASLMSTNLVNAYSIKNISLYTFGQPRVGDYNYSVLHDKLVPDSWRVIHKYDIVPHFPFCLSTGGCNYTNKPYHHGTEVFYDNDMNNIHNYIICKTDEDVQCSDKYYSFGIPITTDTFYDHIYYFGVQVSKFGSNNCCMPRYLGDLSDDSKY